MKSIDNRLPLSREDEDKVYKDIYDENKSEIEKGSVREMSDLIFDTLFENTQYPQFDLDMIDFDDEEREPQVDSKKGLIEFNYGGHYYQIKVEMID